MNSHLNLRDFTALPILENVSDSVVIAAPRPWRVVYANRAARRWLAYPDGGDVDAELDMPLAGKITPGMLQLLDSFWLSGEGQSAIPTELSLEGHLRSVMLHVCRLDAGGQPLLGVVLRSQLEPSDDVFIPAARRDPLTGLPDRAFLLSRLADLMRAQQASGDKFAVLFVDLDNFKQVNDAQGHLIGDRVLREASRRLVQCVREDDHVVRFGGDEFVVLVERVDAQAEVESIIRRIHAVLAKPIALPEGEVTLSVSIGAADAAPEHRSPEDVLAAADRAMYASKRSSG